MNSHLPHVVSEPFSSSFSFGAETRVINSVPLILSFFFFFSLSRREMVGSPRSSSSSSLRLLFIIVDELVSRANNPHDGCECEPLSASRTGDSRTPVDARRRRSRVDDATTTINVTIQTTRATRREDGRTDGRRMHARTQTNGHRQSYRRTATAISLLYTSYPLPLVRVREEKKETSGEEQQRGGVVEGGRGRHETNRSAHARHPAFTFLGRRVSRATRCLNLATRHTDKQRHTHTHKDGLRVYVLARGRNIRCDGRVYTHRRRRVTKIFPRRRR